MARSLSERINHDVFLSANASIGCDNAFLVSALNSEDAGTLNILNSLWTFPEDMIKAGFGNADMDVQGAGRGIPEVGTGSVLGSAECMARCNITH